MRKQDPTDLERSITLRTRHDDDVFGDGAIFADAPLPAIVIALDNLSPLAVVMFPSVSTTTTRRPAPTDPA